MDVRSPPAAIYRFGLFRLESGRMSLTRSGIPIIATPRVISTLLYLVEHVGELVSRDALLRALWPGRMAEEANLSQAISAVRKALATEGDATEWIITIPGRRYRFHGQVEREGAPGEATDPPPISPPTARPPGGAAPRRRAGRGIILSGLAMMLGVGLAGVCVWSYYGRAQPKGHTSVVLAALQNETGEPVFDHVIPRVLQVDLGQSPWLQVASDAKTAHTSSLRA